MSKRFIDTGLFDDPWFMELSVKGKLFWILLITKCNHAGIIPVNDRLFKFHLNANSLETVYEEIGNRLLRLDGGYIFIPKFIEFQYPNGLAHNVKAQQSVIDLLQKHGLWNSEKQTVSKQLPNCCLTDQDKDKDKDTDKNRDKDKEQNIPFEEFWNLYAYKEDIDRCRGLWCGKKKLKTGRCLNDSDREAIMKHVKAYVSSTPDKRYRKHPGTYLYNSGWKNEIVKPDGKGVELTQLQREEARASQRQGHQFEAEMANEIVKLGRLGVPLQEARLIALAEWQAQR